MSDRRAVDGEFDNVEDGNPILSLLVRDAQQLFNRLIGPLRLAIYLRMERARRADSDVENAADILPKGTRYFRITVRLN